MSLVLGVLLVAVLVVVLALGLAVLALIVKELW